MNRSIRIKIPNIFLLSINYEKGKSISSCIFAFIMSVCIIFPHDKYNLKILFLVCLLIYNIDFLCIYRSAEKTDKIAFYMAFVFMPYLIFTSYINTYNIREAIIGAYPTIFFLILYPIRKANINCEKIVIWLIKIVVLLVVVSVFIDAIGILNTEQNHILYFLHENKEILGDYGKRANFSFGYRISYRTYALYLILACYALKERKLIWWLLSFLAVLFTNSSTLLGAFIFCSAFIKADQVMKKNFIKAAFSIALIIIVLAIAVIPFRYDTWDMCVRQDIWTASVNAFSSNPINFFFGFGMGAEIYILSRNSYVSITEISFVQFVREHGLIAFIIFMCIILYPLKTLSKTKERWIVYAAIGFFIVASTNNFFFNSTGFVLYLLLFSKYLRITEKKDIY